VETANRLITSMPTCDRDLLLEESEFIELKLRTQLEEPHRPPTHVYFMESGMASIMYKGRGDHTAEIAVVGNEGCTGCGLILGADHSPAGTIIQVAGSAHRLARPRFISVLDKSPSLRALLLRFVQTQIVQRDETALAASQGTIIERLARWLLMVADRVGESDIALTHDIMALMLSTRRAGVTTALGFLREHGALTLGRGHLAITNRAKLKEIAGVYYGASEAEYSRLVSPCQ
jgi:CRP-like cAMP-binding protein